MTKTISHRRNVWRTVRQASLMRLLQLIFGIALCTILPGVAIAQNAAANEVDPLAVRVHTVTTGAVSEWQFTQGTINAVRREYLTFLQSGRVVYIIPSDKGGDIREGEFVTGPTDDKPWGTLLAELDTAGIRATLEAAEASEAQADAESRLAQLALDRTKTLLARGTATKATLEQDQARYDSAAAGLNAASARMRESQTNLRTAQIHMPFDGVIAFKNIRSGQ